MAARGEGDRPSSPPPADSAGGAGPGDRRPAPLAPPPFRQLPGSPWPAGAADWLTARDGVRLRAVCWRARDARPDAAVAWMGGPIPGAAPTAASGTAATGSDARGTVLLFTGRTEYAEKYAPVAGVLTAAGLDVLTVDWRGQGASDRLIADPAVGHITDFAQYQQDVAALILAAEAMALPRPWHLLAHSMGGCIGLRALSAGLPVASAAFSAPMWGIRFGRLPGRLGAGMAGGLARAAGRAGRGPRAVPAAGTVLDTAFTANPLTGDLEEYIRMLRESRAWPTLTIGPPSYDWLRAALAECRALARLAAPPVPALMTLSGAEMIVSGTAIRARAAGWAGARLLALPGARHEALFEVPATRRTALTAVLAHIDASAGKAPQSERFV